MGKPRYKQEGTSRPPIERMAIIWQQIHAGKLPTAGALARQIEVTSRTIHTDMEFMRDRLGFQFEYDARRGGYVPLPGADRGCLFCRSATGSQTGKISNSRDGC